MGGGDQIGGCGRVSCGCGRRGGFRGVVVGLRGVVVRFRGVVMGNPFVSDFRDEAGVTAHVIGHLLATAVGEVHVIGALGGVAVVRLLVAEVVAALVHREVEVVGLRGRKGRVGREEGAD